MADEIKRTCTTCVLCLREDYGYSNYTCEGTTLHCLARLNPELDDQEDGQWDESQMAKLAPLLDVALTCDRYREGAPATLDVDREGIPYGTPATPEMVKAADYTSDDDEAAQLLAEYLA